MRERERKKKKIERERKSISIIEIFLEGVVKKRLDKRQYIFFEY